MTRLQAGSYLKSLLDSCYNNYKLEDP